MSTAQTLDRDVAQSLITKLDLGHIRPKDAKEFAQKYCGVTLKGRTRDQLVRSINSVIEPARPAPEAGLTEAETLAVIADRRDQKAANVFPLEHLPHYELCARLADALAALHALDAVSWLDRDWSNSDDLAQAKEAARAVIAANPSPSKAQL